LLCSHYAEQFTQLKNAGTPIGANDLWIACHALSIKATLVTHNVSEFNRIKNLTIEDWFK
jgi:tRNA(fMet)-specific endonuclease VapC